jgi:hypothetical protein
MEKLTNVLQIHVNGEKVGTPKKVFPFFVKHSREGFCFNEQIGCVGEESAYFCYMTFSCFFGIVISEISLR